MISMKCEARRAKKGVGTEPTLAHIPLRSPSRPPKPRAHLRLPACHFLTRPLGELEKGNPSHETAERPYKKRMECDQAKMISRP